MILKIRLKKSMWGGREFWFPLIFTEEGERRGSRPAKTGRKRTGVSPKREETRRIDGIPSLRHVQQLVIENVQLLRVSCTINSLSSSILRVEYFWDFFFLWKKMGRWHFRFRRFFFLFFESKNFGKKERNFRKRFRTW